MCHDRTADRKWEQEEKRMLRDMRDFFCSMSDDEFLDYLYENSLSFRNDILQIIDNDI